MCSTVPLGMPAWTCCLQWEAMAGWELDSLVHCRHTNVGLASSLFLRSDIIVVRQGFGGG